MSTAPAAERVARHLREAAERNDTERVGFWAAALEHLNRPIPEYVSFDGLSRHLLPRRETAADLALKSQSKAMRGH